MCDYPPKSGFMRFKALFRPERKLIMNTEKTNITAAEISRPTSEIDRYNTARSVAAQDTGYEPMNKQGSGIDTTIPPPCGR